MAEISPFRGWRYDFDRVGPPESVLAPPYDLLSPERAAQLQAAHPHQIAHLILGHPPDTGVQAPEVYARAAATFREWTSDGILIRDEQPCLYPYLQEFAGPDGIWRRRWGFIAALELRDFSDRVVMPHEEIFARPFEDRLRLTRASMANFTPLFVLYRDAERTVEQALTSVAQPLFSMTDDEAVRHRLYRVQDPDAVEWARTILRDQTLLIADGHHRYAAALSLRDELRAEEGAAIGHGSSVIGHRREAAPWEFCLACLVNSLDEGLVILPTHRLVGAGLRVPEAGKARRDPGSDKVGASGARPQRSAVSGQRSARLEPKEFAPWFRVETIAASEKHKILDFLAQSKCADEIAFALYDGQQFLALAVEDEERVVGAMGSDKPLAWRRLPLAILDQIVFRKILGLGNDVLEDPASISFTERADEAIEAVDSGKSGLAALVFPPPIAEVWQVCESGARMPRKSTFFYPKLASGTVIRDLRDW